MYKGLSSLIFFLALNFSFGQQDKQFTHYMFDKMSYNPAATGFSGYCATFIYRNQWDQVERAPNTTLVNVQGNFPQQNLGLGISWTNDAIGFQRNNTVTLNAAYHFPTPAGILSGGLGIGLINVGFSPNWIPPQTPWDPNLPLPIAGTGFDVNMGLHWHGKKYPYYVGISTTHLVPPTLESINYQVARHYYTLAGYNFRIPNRRQIDLKPSILVKSDGTSPIFDLNTTADVWLNYYSYVWGGFSYRLKDAVAFTVGYAYSPARNVRRNMMKFGYSFDIMTNPLNAYGKGSHELMLNFCVFPPPAVIGKHGNPFILL
jgi:type IX secretion system PorP/SprF family membrane protein